jgi:hypothetical protein
MWKREKYIQDEWEKIECDWIYFVLLVQWRIRKIDPETIFKH